MISFDKLIKYQQIGFYKKSTVLEIFLIKGKRIINFFTIYKLEDDEKNIPEDGFITDKPLSLNEEFKIGIRRSTKTISELKKIYADYNHGQFTSSSNTNQYRELYPKFILSKNSLNHNRINNLLLGNNDSGSYIFEFFDENKQQFNFITDNILGKIEKILEENNILISFKNSTERLGNIIFQFPVTVFNVDMKINNDDTGIDFNFNFNRKLERKMKFYIEIISNHSKGSVNRTIVEYNGKEMQCVPLKDINYGNVEIKIYDKEDINLIYYYSKNGFLGKINVDFGMAVDSHVRQFKYKENNEIINEQIPLVNSEPFSLSVIDDYHYYLEKSEYDEKIENIIDTLDFKEYFKDKDAKSDIRTLIDKNNSDGVYLWDPFLEPNDIFSTLFYSKKMNLPLKAITSKKVFKKGKSFDKNIEEFRECFNQNKVDKKLINLEYRIQHGNYGWSFHDRFLIFPKKSVYESPIVYSLGTSVNSFGKDHNILQKVLYPQSILNSFNNLWNQLDNENCIIWKSIV